MNPFDIIKDISFEKKNIIDDSNEKLYNPWLVNKGLSYFPDTIEYANNMNILHNLDHKLQHDYLINVIRKRKRFSKWFKASKNEDLDMIMRYYSCNRQKAKSYLQILSLSNLQEMRDNYLD